MHRPHPLLHKVVSLICTPTTTYPFVISNCIDMTVSQVTDNVLYKGLIEMQEMDASGRSPEVALGFTPIYIK